MDIGTTTMFMLVDVIAEDGSGVCFDGNPPLTFLTREEATRHRRGNQHIIERDGCPQELALVISNATYALLRRQLAVNSAVMEA